MGFGEFLEFIEIPPAKANKNFPTYLKYGGFPALPHFDLDQEVVYQYIGKAGTKEIDFIAIKANKKIYIQVAYLLASEQTIEREFAPLLAIRDNYPKYVLSMDTIFGDDYDGVIRRNLVDFLLDVLIFVIYLPEQ